MKGGAGENNFCPAENTNFFYKCKKKAISVPSAHALLVIHTVFGHKQIGLFFGICRESKHFFSCGFVGWFVFSQNSSLSQFLEIYLN